MQSSSAEILQNAIRHHQAGRMAEAENLYRRILEGHPDHCDALHLLGTLIHQRGDSHTAIKFIQQAIAIYPDNALYHFSLSTIQLMCQNYPASIRSGEQALRLKPDYPAAHLNVACALKAQRRFAKALDHLQQAIAIAPNFSAAYVNAGNIHLELDEADTALHYYEHALQIDPCQPQTLFNLGNVYMVLGKLEQAQCHFRKALELKPDYGDAYRAISSIKRFEKDDSDIRKMEGLLAQTNLAPTNRMLLNFSLGKAYEDIAEYEQAFAAINTANRIKRSHLNYAYTADEAYCQRLMAVFNKDFFAQREGWGMPDAAPLFIVGMPRSGSTLVERILATHPQTHGAGEITDLEETIASFHSGGEGGAFPESLRAVDRHWLNTIAQTYLDRLQRFGSQWRYISNKLLSNFLLLGMIRLLWPNARVIHCRRDPMDTCWSCFKHHFADGQAYSYDLVELGRYYKLYQQLMQHWHDTMPGWFYDIQYENLINDQEGETRRLLEFLSLPWNEECLSFHQARSAVKTASAIQVRRPLYQRSLRLWRHYKQQLAPLAAIILEDS